MRYEHLWRSPAPSVAFWVKALSGQIHAASNPFADWYFGTQEVAREILEEWMARPTSEVYVGRAIVMLDAAANGGGERPMGCLIALDGSELARSRAADFAAFCADLGAGDEAAAAIDHVVSVSRQLFVPVAEDELYISRVAIDETARGRGLGSHLVAHAIETHQSRGYRKFRLDVSADNAAAIRAYEGSGLKIIGKARSEDAGLEYCAMALSV